MQTQTQHTVRVLFIRDDREEPIVAGEHTFHGEDPAGFDAAAARARLVDDGELVIGPELVTFAGTIAPLARVDRIVVEIVASSRPPTPEEAAAVAASLAAQAE